MHLHGGPAPVRRFLPELIDLIWTRQIDPGKVFDLTLPLAEAAEGHKAMDERRASRPCCGHTVDGHAHGAFAKGRGCPTRSRPEHLNRRSHP